MANNWLTTSNRTKAKRVCSSRARYVILISIAAIFILCFTDGELFANFSPTSVKRAQEKKIKFAPVILSWNSNARKWLPSVLGSAMTNCPVECELTHDRSRLQSAGAVVFHVRDVKLGDLPQHRDRNQLYTFFLLEPPKDDTAGELEVMAKDYFTITMTFRLDSDIVFSYGKMNPITATTAASNRWEWKTVEEIVDKKNKSILQFVSRCQTNSRREDYIKELRKHIQFTQYGECGRGNCRGKCEDTAIAEHRFYLAFENSVCRDYVTEKFFTRIVRLMVPIVLQKANYKEIAPEGSYIAADDFESPKHLADYLHYLENNRTAFMRYFEWTKTFEKNINSSGTCELCKLLHKGIGTPKINPDIQGWWYDKGPCALHYGKHIVNNEGLRNTKPYLGKDIS